MLKIISGGQTGVDRGALDAALDLGAQCGGWCPAGRLAEDGTIPSRYPVVELADAGYAERTAQNVADADGTLIISNGKPIGGTAETVARCVEMQKPYLVIDCDRTPADEAIEGAVHFISDLSFQGPPPGAEGFILQLAQRDPSASLGMIVLNVAGPRASQWPEGHALTYNIMSAILRRMIGQTPAN